MDWTGCWGSGELLGISLGLAPDFRRSWRRGGRRSGSHPSPTTQPGYRTSSLIDTQSGAGLLWHYLLKLIPGM